MKESQEGKLQNVNFKVKKQLQMKEGESEEAFVKRI